MKTFDLSENKFVRADAVLADVLDAAETEVAEYTPSVTEPWKLQYTDQDAQTQTFLTNQAAKDLLLHRASWKYGHIFKETDTFDIGDLGEAFYREFRAWWARRGDAFGWLEEMLKRRDYDPLENYDRKEDGGWSDTTDIGARSGTHNLTDSYATFTDTDTETPTVKTKETVTPTVKTRETVTPTVKTKTTETPTVKTKETVTPTVKTKETVTPTVKSKVTETPAVTDTTVETPGVSTTVSESIYGDNSSTEVPNRKTVTSPGANQTNQTQLSHTGTNETVNEILSGDTQTVNEVVSGNTETVKETVSGTNETVNEVVSGDTQTVNEVVSGNTETTREVVSGNTQTTRLHGAHIDTHNTTTGSVAAQDVVTRLYDEYRVHGNIGVTAVSDMLLKEYNLRSVIDLQRMAIEEITNQLCYLAE